MKTLVIAPHPDDEVIGCGGTLLRRKAQGGETGWLIVTGISEEAGWGRDRVQSRDNEIEKVADLMGFDKVYNLKLKAAQLDEYPINLLISKFSEVISEFSPQEVLVPHRSDIHTDHRVVFDVSASCLKWFRNPSVQRVLAYETLSETDFNLDSDTAFNPNVFVDVAEYLEKKLEIMAVYESELSPPPFPRSLEALRAQALVRGVASGFHAAEAFQLLRERI